MSQKHHVRTIEIHTLTATCDECGLRSPASALDTLVHAGWRLSTTRPDLCPECAEVARGLERVAGENEARAKHIAALESGEPLYVHGRVYVGTAELRTRAEIDAEIAHALRKSRSRWR
jgi:hypothetical protein